MSEKNQRTTESMREKMSNRYGDEYHHKHNKNHMPFRQHYRSHPCISDSVTDKTESPSGPTGILRKFKLRKIRKRLAKGQFH